MKYSSNKPTKHRIRITESDIHNIVESVLNEINAMSYEDYWKNAANQGKDARDRASAAMDRHDNRKQMAADALEYDVTKIDSKGYRPAQRSISNFYEDILELYKKYSKTLPYFKHFLDFTAYTHSIGKNGNKSTPEQTEQLIADFVTMLQKIINDPMLQGLCKLNRMSGGRGDSLLNIKKD